jgi:putative ABC transport system substrate-binding protein
LLKAAVPPITHVAVLIDPAMPSHKRSLSHVKPEARVLGLQLRRVKAGNPETFAAAFVAMAEHRAEAFMLVDYAQLGTHAQQLVELALVHRMPTIAAPRFYAELGSLLAYGVNPREQYPQFQSPLA